MTPELLAQWAREAGFGSDMPGACYYEWQVEFDCFAALVAAHEREQCAKECDDIADSAWALWRIGADPIEQGRNIGAEHCAQAIRARP